MKMMMPCLHSFNFAVVITFSTVVYYCFTEMHLCPILVLVDVIVTAPFVLDTERMCQFVSLCSAHLCISGAKLYYLNYICLLLFLNDCNFILFRVLPDIHHNI